MVGVRMRTPRPLTLALLLGLASAMLACAPTINALRATQAALSLTCAGGRASETIGGAMDDPTAEAIGAAVAEIACWAADFTGRRIDRAQIKLDAVEREREAELVEAGSELDAAIESCWAEPTSAKLAELRALRDSCEQLEAAP